MNLWSQSHSHSLVLMLGHTGWCEHMKTVIWAFFCLKKQWPLSHSSMRCLLGNSTYHPNTKAVQAVLPATVWGFRKHQEDPLPWIHFQPQHLSTLPWGPNCTGSLSTEDTWVSAEGRGCDAEYKCYFCNLRPDPEPSVPAAENGQMLNEQKQHSDKALLWRVNEMT